MAIKLDILTSGEPTNSQLAAFKGYAAVAGCHLNEMLKGLLKTAFTEVGAWEDKALIAQTYRLTVSGRESNDAILLYRGAGEVTSVQDGKGEAIPFERDGESILPGRFSETVVVEYAAEVRQGNVDRYLPKVLRYATALYDGEGQEVLQKLLTQR